MTKTPSFLLQFFCVILFSPLISASKNETKFQLSISRGLLGLYCEISGLELLEPDLGLSIPYDIDGEAAIDVTITNSTVPHFTKVFCQVFPNINWLIANSVKIEELEEDAFYPCQKLKFLYLNDNQIKRLPTELFARNSGLLRLKIMKNKLKSDSLSPISRLTNLIELDLSGNELTEFPIENMKKLTHLHELYLQSNYLRDIDERRLIEYFPNLMWIYLADNDFMCSRLERIVDDLKRHGKMLEIDNAAPLRQRVGAKVSSVRGIHCIADTDYPLDMVKNVTCKDLKELMKEMQAINHNFRHFMQEVQSELYGMKQLLTDQETKLDMSAVNVETATAETVTDEGQASTFEGSGN